MSNWRKRVEHGCQNMFFFLLDTDGFFSLDFSTKPKLWKLGFFGVFPSNLLTTSSERGLCVFAKQFSVCYFFAPLKNLQSVRSCLFHEPLKLQFGVFPSLEKRTASLHLKIGRNLKKHDNFQPSIFRSENVSFRELYLSLWPGFVMCDWHRPHKS